MGKPNINISFCGENSFEVTGSCIHIQTPNRQILLECGLWQSAGEVSADYKVNSRHFSFKPKKIDYVFLCHCHIDHSGRIPLLFKRGCEGKVIMPTQNKKLVELLLNDSAHIASVDARTLASRYGRYCNPIYDIDDVGCALANSTEYPFGQRIELDEYVSFRFTPAGHIIGSAQLELWLTDGGVTKKILYTSDLGNEHIQGDYKVPFVPVKKADIVIGESTYGGERRIASQKTRDSDLKKLKDTIERVCVEDKGRILIPVFANQRSQQMLTALYDILSESDIKVPVIFDTPLGTRICRAYSDLLRGEDAEKWERVVNWDGVIFTEEATKSKAWLRRSEPAIILSSSGMMTNGRSRSWCEALLPDERNTILFCGFSVDNSLASVIKSGEHRKIKFHGKMIPNRCRVVDLHSFSSHMQQDSLVKYYGSIECSRVFLVHGEKESKDELSELIREEAAKNNITSKVVVVDKGMTFGC